MVMLMGHLGLRSGLERNGEDRSGNGFSIPLQTIICVHPMHLITYIIECVHTFYTLHSTKFPEMAKTTVDLDRYIFGTFPISITDFRRKVQRTNCS